MIIGKALAYYWKLKAIESIEKSSDVRHPKEELTQLINTLIDNHSIRDILIKKPLSYPPEGFHHININRAKKQSFYDEYAFPTSQMSM